MNRPRRPGGPPPPRRRPSGPPRPPSGPGGPSFRRRSPLDNLPQGIEPPFKVLGTDVDRQMLTSGGEPLELVVIQGYTREIEEAYQKFKGPYDEFWAKNPPLVEKLRKLDDILAGIQTRRRGG